MNKIISVWKAINSGRHQSVARRKPIKAIASSDSPEAASKAYLGSTRSILGTSTKVQKGEEFEYMTKVMYLAPFNLSGLQVCPYATPACKRDCLGHSSGNLVFQQQSEILRTWAMHYYPSVFNFKLDNAIKMLGFYASLQNMHAAVRLNGSSDLDWSETVARHASSGVQFYDYTKDYERAVKSIGTEYHHTFSVSERPESIEKAVELVRKGGTAAIVTHRKPQEALEFGRWMSVYYDIPVNDGDRHDLRFLDKGSMVTLSAKGSMKDSSPFVWTEDRIRAL